MIHNRDTQRILIWLSIGLLIPLLCLGGAAVGWLFTSAGTLKPVGNTESPSPQVSSQQLDANPPAQMLPTATPLSVRESANELEAQIESVYQRVGSGVVNITNRSFELDFFMRPTPREGTGSGFFYDSQGHIVTNYHVIQNAEELQVTLADGRTVPATLVGSDPSNDLAVIRADLPAEEISVVPVNSAPNLRVGQFVVAIGNPFGLERTLTFGVVSSLGRVIESPNQRFIGEVIQTDAAVNPGNSGGPLLNLAGEVVGVNSAILSPSGASAGIGFSIPAKTVQRVVPALIQDGRYPHPSLGVQLFELTPDWIDLLERAGMDIPKQEGLLVVETSRSAARAGLRTGDRQARIGNLLVPIGGDIITAVNGTPTPTVQDLIVYLETQTRVGETVDVTVIRDGEEVVVPVELVELAQ
jgi:S1-C subfamily serine protease